MNYAGLRFFTRTGTNFPKCTAHGNNYIFRHKPLLPRLIGIYKVINLHCVKSQGFGGKDQPQNQDVIGHR